MDKKMLREILAAHADQLVKGKATSKDYLELLPEQDEELAPLLDVAEQVQSTLRRISPANKFERDLKKELLTTAQQRQAEGYSTPNASREVMLLIATISFFLSLTGVLIAIRRRSQPI
jgi:hypothetical protein